MIATRSMQLTLKKTTATFKTLEGNLVVMKDGTRQNVSTRCAELESLMPIYLGASKSIFENVIFCHQEESLWPLSEPSALKKKFDEIFEAQKFTKALDNIKVLRKEYANDIKLLQQRTDYLKADRDKAILLEADVERITNEIAGNLKNVDRLSTNLEAIVKDLEQLMTSKQTFRDVLYELDYLKKSIETDMSNIAELRSSIELLPLAESQLHDEIRNFSSKTQEYETTVNEAKQNIQQKKEELTASRRHYNEKILKQGVLQAAHETYLSVAASRSQAVANMCGKLDIPAAAKERIQKKLDIAKKDSVSQLDPVDYEEFFQIVQHLSSSYRHEMDAERNSNLLLENQHEQKVQKATTERLQHEQEILNHGRSVRQFTEKIAALKRKISGVAFNESDLAYEESQLADIENSIKESNDLVEKITTGGEIEEKEQQLQRISQDIDKLNEELKIVNNESETHAKLSVLSEDLKKREHAHNALLDAKKQDFLKFGIDIGAEASSSSQTETIEQQLRKTIESHQNSYDQATHDLDSSQRQLALAESRLAMNTQKLEAFETEKKQVLDKIYSEIDFDHHEYASRIADLESQEADLSAEIGQAGFFKNLHQRAIQDAEAHNRCLMCFREFTVSEEKDGFLRIISEKEERINDIDKLKTTYAQVVEAIKVLRSIAPSIGRLETLEKTLIPFDSNRKPELESEVKEKSEAVAKSKETLQKRKEELETVEQLQRPATDLTRNTNELSSIKAQISTTKAQLSNSSQYSEILSSNEILEKLSAKGEESKGVRKELDKLIETRDQMRAKISNLQVSKSEKTQSIDRLCKELQVKTISADEISAIEKDRDSTNKIIAQEKKLLEDVCTKVSALEKERNEIKSKAVQREAEMSGKYGAAIDAENELQRMTKTILQYEQEQGKNKLEECQNLVSTLDEQIKSIENAIEQSDGELKKAEKSLSGLNVHERLLKDNLKLLEMEKDIEVKRERIEELEKENADAEKVKFEEQAQSLRQEEANISSERAGIYGEIRQLDDQLSSVTTQLNRDYKTTVEDYKKSLLKLQTTVVANDDLGKYSRALDSAIMSYHSLKMQEINRIVDDLWKKTYAGTDVDTILIKSENETSRGGRTYNYRVCMVKQDVELDMRGRCSAGQKVLASIIIRLALAECFGVNCGLIALDEPTTNLDEDNIESLAKALNQIIATRQQQKNFQLIVITHDEKFLAHMNASAYTDCFYRVSRNERQMSQIEWVPISQIQE